MTNCHPNCRNSFLQDGKKGPKPYTITIHNIKKPKYHETINSIKINLYTSQRTLKQMNRRKFQKQKMKPQEPTQERHKQCNPEFAAARGAGTIINSAANLAHKQNNPRSQLSKIQKPRHLFTCCGT